MENIDNQYSRKFILHLYSRKFSTYFTCCYRPLCFYCLHILVQGAYRIIVINNHSTEDELQIQTQYFILIARFHDML